MTCKPKFEKDTYSGMHVWACHKGCYPIACMTPRHHHEAHAFEIFEKEFQEKWGKKRQ